MRTRHGRVKSARRVIHHVVYRCSPRRTPRSEPVLATSCYPPHSVPVHITSSTKVSTRPRAPDMALGLDARYKRNWAFGVRAAKRERWGLPVSVRHVIEQAF